MAPAIAPTISGPGHFGRHLGRVDRDVTQPRADHVDIHARAPEVRGALFRVQDYHRAMLDRFASRG
jgi:hypothetical protein